MKRPENQWLLTWTLQEIYSMNEKPGKWGLWGSQPPQEEFFINTDDLDAARHGRVGLLQGMRWCRTKPIRRSMPKARRTTIFAGYETHIISGNKVLRRI